MLAECSESGQLAFYQQNGTITIIDGRLLVKEKRIDILRIIDEKLDQPLIDLQEMDDSFLEMVLASEIRIA
jgi:hypothetical protein